MLGVYSTVYDAETARLVQRSAPSEVCREAGSAATPAGCAAWVTVQVTDSEDSVEAAELADDSDEEENKQRIKRPRPPRAAAAAAAAVTAADGAAGGDAAALPPAASVPLVEPLGAVEGASHWMIAVLKELNYRRGSPEWTKAAEGL